MLSTVLRGLAAGYLRLDATIERARIAALGAAGGLFSEILTPGEQGAVTLAVYERRFRSPSRRALSEWERAWFSSRLPAPPARLLVGAAGDGVEVGHLAAQGYRVDALEPSPGAARGAAAAGAETVCVARYEDLTSDVLEGRGGPARLVAERRYDAVLLGWSSLSHVLEVRERARLVRACDRLAPHGPILASFLERAMPATTAGRAHAAGTALGRLLGRDRRRGAGVSEEAAATSFGSWYGFIHLFTREEIDALGREAGRRVVWGADTRSGYPHVTFECDPGSSEEPAGRSGASCEGSVSS